MIDIITETPGLSEDFAVAPDGTFFMGVGTTIYYFHPDKHTSWQQVQDLSIFGIQQITRMTISADGKQLALVSVIPSK